MPSGVYRLRLRVFNVKIKMGLITSGSRKFGAYHENTGDSQVLNTKLVESLVQMIEALPSEDYLLLQGQLTDRNIQKTEGVCGGYARIRNTRIPVWTIVSLHNQGADEAELLRNFPSLTLFNLAATRAYYATHQAEIDRLIASHDEEDLTNG